MKKGQISSYLKQSTISCFYKLLFLEQYKILSQKKIFIPVVNTICVLCECTQIYTTCTEQSIKD